MTRHALPTVALALICASPLMADDPKPKGDLAKFQGKWSTKIGPDGGFDATIDIKDKILTLKLTTPDGQDFELTGEVKLDEAAKPHKTIDWTKFKSPAGDDVPENLGIYKLEDDDTIKVCNGGPGNDRPSEFKTEEGGAHVITLKRVVDKPKDKEKEKEKEVEKPK